MTGRLIGVVGPSGVGKDTLMRALADARPDIGLVRRVITRAASLGGEDFEAVTEAEFARRIDAGAFCLHWHAHGLHYGIPDAVRGRVAAGETLLVNLSRSILNEAARIVPRFAVLNVTALPETLALRLAERGRETPEEIATRLARSAEPLPGHIDVLTVANDGPLRESVRTALTLLQPERA